jgi:hypothetical protein
MDIHIHFNDSVSSKTTYGTCIFKDVTSFRDIGSQFQIIYMNEQISSYVSKENVTRVIQKTEVINREEKEIYSKDIDEESTESLLDSDVTKFLRSFRGNSSLLTLVATLRREYKWNLTTSKRVAQLFIQRRKDGYYL